MGNNLLSQFSRLDSVTIYADNSVMTGRRPTRTKSMKKEVYTDGTNGNVIFTRAGQVGGMTKLFVRVVVFI